MSHYKCKLNQQLPIHCSMHLTVIESLRIRMIEAETYLNAAHHIGLSIQDCIDVVLSKLLFQLLAKYSAKSFEILTHIALTSISLYEF